MFLLKHKTDGEAQDVFSAIEYHILCAHVVFKVDGRKTLGYVVQSILECEVKEYTGNIYAKSCHEAEV